MKMSANDTHQNKISPIPDIHCITGNTDKVKDISITYSQHLCDTHQPEISTEKEQRSF